MESPVVAFVGNPNVGKSTIFNLLTGLKQHTGNWTGKTVEVAQGEYTYKNMNFTAIDLPGTYSLVSNSPEEEITREFLCCNGVDVAVVICDMVCLERNLNLVYQTLEITDNVVVCINLADYGKKKGFTIDTNQLSEILGVSVVLTSGKTGDGVENLKEEILKTALNKKEKTTAKINYNSVLEAILIDIQDNLKQLAPKEKIKDDKGLRWYAVRLLCADQFIRFYLFGENVPQEIENSVKEGEKIIALSFGNEKTVEDVITEKIVHTSHKCAEKVMTIKNKNWQKIDRTIDRYVTSKVWGIPLMIALLFLVFWLTITGANYPSDLLFKFFFFLEEKILNVLNSIGINQNIVGVLVLGVYRVVVWVVSVMLPPMAIFFPLFAVLEDLGYLPRIAFNLDNVFCKAGCCGKQALTTCMVDMIL